MQGKKKNLEEQIAAYEENKDEEEGLGHKVMNQEELDVRDGHIHALMQVFEEAVVQKLVSQNWQQREEALKQVIGQLGKQPLSSKEGYSSAVNSLCNLFYYDKVARLAPVTLKLSQCLVETGFKQDSVERTLAFILDKTAADNKQTQALAQTTYLAYLKANVFEDCVSFLADKKSYFNPQVRNSVKQLMARLELVQKIALQDADPAHAASFQPLNALLLQGAENKSAVVRAQAQQTLLTLKNKYGFHAIEPIIKKSSPESLKVLVKQIPEVEPFWKEIEQNQRQLVANRDKSYGGGGSIPWAPNLNKTTANMKESKPVAKNKTV